MSFTFAGTTIAGINTSFVAHSPQFRAVRTHHWGVEGETEIVSRNGAREVMVTILHYNSYTDLEDLLAGLQTYDDLVGSHGLLEDDTIDAANPPFPANTAATQYPNCTLEQMQMIPMSSQPSPGPLKDDAGCLDDGWFIHLQFRFRQLLTKPNGRRPAAP